MKSTWGASENNIGLIRFVLASIVVLVHVQNLSLLPSLAFIPRLLSSAIAVQGFFVLSGYLVIASFERSKSFRSYAEKRIRRLYPAYVVSVLGFAVVLWLVSSVSFSTYFSKPFFSYAFFNLIFANFVRPTIADVFAGNPKESAINGALWTLKLEVMFYCCVPFIALAIRRIGSAIVLGGLFLASVAYVVILNKVTGGQHDITKQLPGQLTYFCVGSALYYYSDRMPLRPLAAVAVGLAIFALSEAVLPLVLRPIGLGLVIIGLAYGPYVGPFEKRGDFSYGIYIIHFPIIQLLISRTTLTNYPLLLLITGYAAAFTGAIFMWNFVEKPFLSRKNHYRAETETPSTNLPHVGVS